jgi:hypothetical protein
MARSIGEFAVVGQGKDESAMLWHSYSSPGQVQSWAGLPAATCVAQAREKRDFGTQGCETGGVILDTGIILGILWLARAVCGRNIRHALNPSWLTGGSGFLDCVCLEILSGGQ